MLGSLKMNDKSLQSAGLGISSNQNNYLKNKSLALNTNSNS